MLDADGYRAQQHISIHGKLAAEININIVSFGTRALSHTHTYTEETTPNDTDSDSFRFVCVLRTPKSNRKIEHETK